MEGAIAIIVAGGSGSRLGSEAPKQFLPVLGKPLLAHTVARVRASGAVSRVVLVLPHRGFEEASRLMADYLGEGTMVPGGESRQDSVREGLASIDRAFDGLVAVHDGARPAVPPALVAAVVAAAGRDSGAIAALPVVETLKRVSPDLLVEGTVDRERFFRAQTPQCFGHRLLRRAVDRAREEGFAGTDEAVLVERLGAAIRIVPGSERNLKVTTVEDLERVEYYLKTGGDL
jgi:2-C-methyl-D-erythritol 4-phosphate cytidylyltransferase